ncbi:MAG: CCA tRNA nucleotidyltransferase [Nitrospirae bacterium]|nr:CCA tRNA nucleotidyltransferase [Nitrospirota bacterium]
MPQTLFEKFIEFAEKKGLSEKLYIVGGAVRDMYMQNELKDIDIAVIGNALELARVFASEAEASYVLLDEDFAVARIVKDSQIIDLANMRCGTLDIDLLERDLTINAMALPLRYASVQDLKQIVDPLNGLSDIENRVVRMVADENFLKDPLRLLRVYRFAATLNYSIENRTREAVASFAEMITSVPGERVAEELRQILRTGESGKIFSLMLEDGLFQKIFKKGDPERILSLYCKIENILNSANDMLPEDFVKNYPVIICLKLSTLFESEKSLLDFLSAMRISRRESELTKKYFCDRNAVANLYNLKALPDNSEAVSLLMKFKHDIYPLSILAIALDSKITDYCKSLISFYENEFKSRESLLPLINGSDIKKEFNLNASPMFKKILEAVEKEVLEGRITTKEQALSIALKEINQI